MVGYKTGLFAAVTQALKGETPPARDPRATTRSAIDASVLADIDALRRAGRLPEALAAIDAVSAGGAADDPALALVRGRVLRAWGRDVESVRALSRGATAPAPTAEDLHGLAWAAERRLAPVEAGQWWTRALARDPADAEAAIGRARAYLMAGDVANAVLAAEFAHRNHPASPEAGVTLADAYRQQGRLDLAEGVLRRIAAARPDDPMPLEQLAVLLAAQFRDDDAVDLLERARALAHGAGAVDVNLGIGLRRVGRARDGLETLLGALRRRPDLNGQLELGPALLAVGEFAEGWRQYENRWLVPPLAEMRAAYDVPHWRGQPLDGRTILVRCEQGLGDTFQFARYLPMLKARGATVLLLPLRGLERVARRFPGIDRVVLEGERLPPLDYYANLLSLPLAFGTRVDTIPSRVPYLDADATLAAQWGARLRRDDKLLVGVIWAGRPEHSRDRLRSMSLAQLAPLLAVPGVRFVSLQKGAPAVQQETVPESVDWLALGAELDDLEDVAAVVSQLDVLVGVDTGLAHLAGALGKDVWLMLPTPSEFRWLVDGAGSPWYPTMRLFRQRTPREWHEVADDVARALRERVGNRHPAQRAPVETFRSPAPLDAAATAGLARAAETRHGFLQYVPDQPLVGESLEHYGEWLAPVLASVLRLLPPGATVVEAGAGIGAHTLPISRALRASGTLLAWESDERLRAVLQLNLGTHRCANATVMTRSLGAPSAEGFGPRAETIDDLRLDRLDGIVLQAGVDAAAVLAGARETLWRARPAVVATSFDAATLDPVRTTLRDVGYRCSCVDAPLFPADNFNRRDDDRFGGRSATMLIAIPEERAAAAASPASAAPRPV